MIIMQPSFFPILLASGKKEVHEKVVVSSFLIAISIPRFRRQGSLANNELKCARFFAHMLLEFWILLAIFQTSSWSWWHLPVFNLNTFCFA